MLLCGLQLLWLVVSLLWKTSYVLTRTWQSTRPQGLMHTLTHHHARQMGCWEQGALALNPWPVIALL